MTNGRALFLEGSENSAWSCRYRDLIAGHCGDLGGAEALSKSQKSLIRRASAIECELEQMEGRLSQGDAVDLDVFTRAAGHLRRILELLGLERRPRDIQTLPEFLATFAPDKRADAVDEQPEAVGPGEQSPIPDSLKPMVGDSNRR